MRRAIVWMAVLAAVSVAAPVRAADSKHVFRFGANYSSPTGDLSAGGTLMEDLGDGTLLVFDGNETTELDSSMGIALGYEYRMSDLIGFDFNLLWGNHDVDYGLAGDYQILDAGTLAVLQEGVISQTSTIGDTDVMPLTAGVNFHLFRGKAADVYVGPFAAYVSYSDVKTDIAGTLTIKSDFSFGAVAGIDVPFGKEGWVFNGALRYVDTQAEPDQADSDALDVNPWMAQVGLGYRF